jgi:hypothetical protein
MNLFWFAEWIAILQTRRPEMSEADTLEPL